MFEILLTIFIEMIFDIAVVAQATDDESKSQDFNFKPDLKKFDLDLFIGIIKKKFNRISYLCNVTVYDKATMSPEEKEEVQKIVNERYCRIILKHNPDDKKIFRQKRITENYHMILNELYEQKEEMRDIYAIIMLNEKIYQVYFDPVVNYNRSSETERIAT